MRQWPLDTDMLKGPHPSHMGARQDWKRHKMTTNNTLGDTQDSDKDQDSEVSFVTFQQRLWGQGAPGPLPKIVVLFSNPSKSLKKRKTLQSLCMYHITSSICKHEFTERAQHLFHNPSSVFLTVRVVTNVSCSCLRVPSTSHSWPFRLHAFRNAECPSQLQVWPTVVSEGLLVMKGLGKSLSHIGCDRS